MNTTLTQAISHKIEGPPGDEGMKGDKGEQGEKGEKGFKGGSGERGKKETKKYSIRIEVYYFHKSVHCFFVFIQLFYAHNTGVLGRTGNSGRDGPKGEKGDPGPKGTKYVISISILNVILNLNYMIIKLFQNIDW